MCWICQDCTNDLKVTVTLPSQKIRKQIALGKLECLKVKQDKIVIAHQKNCPLEPNIRQKCWTCKPVSPLSKSNQHFVADHPPYHLDKFGPCKPMFCASKSTSDADRPLTILKYLDSCKQISLLSKSAF